MPIQHIIKEAKVVYDGQGSVLNIHVEGITPTKYSDGSVASGEPFGVDFDSTTFGLKWHELFPDDDSAAIAVKQFTVLGAVIADHMPAPPGT